MSKKIKILIAEDRKVDRRLLRKMLEGGGYEVVQEAANGQEGLEIARLHKPDLIISDAMMPVMDGFRFLRNIKKDKDLKNIPFIFYSAVYTGRMDEKLALSLGARAFVEKPTEPSEFMKKLKTIIQEIKAGEEPAPVQLIEEEEEYLRKYSDVVATKLEEKVEELEKANKELQSEITERKQAEEALRESEEHLKTILDSIQTGIVVIDAEHIIIDANPAAIRMIGASKEQIIGHVCHKYICPAEKGKCPITDLGQKEDNVERILLTANGEEVSILKTVTTVLLGGKECLLNTFIDITEKKKLEEQFRQSQKMEAIGILAGGVAHDFNNILGGIIGYTELAQFDTPEGSRIRTRLDQVLKSAERAKNLVQQILAFRRQGEQEEKPIQLAPIIKEVLKMLRASIPTTIEIRQNIQRESGSIVVDPTQVHQVLMNLCTNAAHAMSEKGGILEVSFEDVDFDEEAIKKYTDLEPGSYVKVTVNDTGHGMSEAIKEKIFDPYFTTKDEGVGTGLGLSVVHGIVKSHGGEVSVESKPGRGTTFEVLLPRINITPAEVTETLEILPTGNEHVLFVDDEHALVEIGQQMLEHLGYQPVSKTSPIEALEAFQAEPDKFDLVITDQTMPIMTGQMLAKKLLSIRPDIPIVLCTGFSDLITEEKARAMGIREFVMKPILMNDFAKTVKKALGKD